MRWSELFGAAGLAAALSMGVGCGAADPSPAGAAEDPLAPAVAFGGRQHRGHVGEGTKEALVGDVNGDGCDDVVYVGANAAATYLSTCTGAFGPRLEATFNAQGSRQPRLNDVDADGRDDLIFMDADSTAVLFADGQGHYAGGPVGTHAHEAGVPLTFDRNHDGRADLLFLALGGGIAWYQGRGNGTFGARGTLGSGDSTDGVIVAVQGGWRERYFRPRQVDWNRAIFTAARTYSAYQFDVLGGDFRGLGIELAVVEPDEVSVLRGLDLQHFAHAHEGTRLAFATDLNRDGLEDLIYAGPSDAAVYFSTGDSAVLQSPGQWRGGFRAAPRFLHPDEGAAVPRLGDANGDGRPDLYYLSPGAMVVYPSTGP